MYIRLCFTLRLATDLIRIASRSENGSNRTGTGRAVNKSGAAALKNSGETLWITTNDAKQVKQVKQVRLARPA